MVDLPLVDLLHCLKSVQIQNFFWSVFSPNTGKYRPEKAPYLDTFHSVLALLKMNSSNSAFKVF